MITHPWSSPELAISSDIDDVKGTVRIKMSREVYILNSNLNVIPRPKAVKQSYLGEDVWVAYSSMVQAMCVKFEDSHTRDNVKDSLRAHVHKLLPGKEDEVKRAVDLSMQTNPRLGAGLSLSLESDYVAINNEKYLEIFEYFSSGDTSDDRPLDPELKKWVDRVVSVYLEHAESEPHGSDTSNREEPDRGTSAVLRAGIDFMSFKHDWSLEQERSYHYKLDAALRRLRGIISQVERYQRGAKDLDARKLISMLLDSLRMNVDSLTNKELIHAAKVGYSQAEAMEILDLQLQPFEATLDSAESMYSVD